MTRPAVCCFFLFLFICAVGLHASAETWTNQRGETMTAELRGVEGDKAVLVRENRVYRYPIAHLIEADQKRVREFAEKTEQARVQRAREQMEKNERLKSQRPQGQGGQSRTDGLIINSLRGQLVQIERRGAKEVSPSALDHKKLFAFYYSAEWCPPCRQFTPELVSFYNRVKEAYPAFEIVFVSSDRSKEAMETYMKNYRMNFPAVKYESRALPAVQRYSGSGIPNLVFVDGTGTVISQSYRGGNYVGPRAVLEDINRYLTEGRL
jgi:nucleoredoxin